MEQCGLRTHCCDRPGGVSTPTSCAEYCNGWQLRHTTTWLIIFKQGLVQYGLSIALLFFSSSNKGVITSSARPTVSILDHRTYSEQPTRYKGKCHVLWKACSTTEFGIAIYASQRLHYADNGTTFQRHDNVCATIAPRNCIIAMNRIRNGTDHPRHDLH